MEHTGQSSGADSTRGRLARFAADALDWPAVRELLRRLVVAPLGQRALDELAPREPADVRAALERARELLALLRAEGGEPPLGGASDPRGVLERAEKFQRTMDGDELSQVARFLFALEDLYLWLGARRACLPQCAALFARLPDLAPLREELEAALDKKGEVKDDASPQLARLRQAIAALEQAIEKTLQALLRDRELRTAVAEGHAGRVHRRGGRPVLALRAQYVHRVPGIVHDRSQTGETVFVEPQAVVQHANALSELEADAGREEHRVLSELTRAVLLRRDTLRTAAERASELELAALAARYARETRGCIPRLAEGERPALVLREFRHPLLLEEQRLGHLESVVPLDLRLGSEFDLLVITGPNTGGKTLALKSAGLAALLTRMGLALPCAEGTSVPLYDGVAADIGDEQEIQQSLSTFSSHLVRIRAGLTRAGKSTLVLLDELGGGTDPSEGAALGEALLEELLTRGAPTLASTHIGALKEFAYRHERAENAHVEFDVESLRPLYRLVIGAPGESRALAIARRLGLPGALLDRAAALIGTAGDGSLMLDEVRDLRVAAEKLRGEAEDKLQELERARAELASSHEELAGRRAQVDAEAQRMIEERIASARSILVRARTILPQLAPAGRGELERWLAELEESLGGAALSDRRASFVAALKKGELVWLPKFKKRVQVTRIYKDKKELDVKLGARELRVSFDDVTFYESL
ncbi:MAG: endonuclease MutS2 [Planctomycetes bacterium]|nr:endonuclease MutS2 [Planctomycetota bacterium]